MPDDQIYAGAHAPSRRGAQPFNAARQRAIKHAGDAKPVVKCVNITGLQSRVGIRPCKPARGKTVLAEMHQRCAEQLLSGFLSGNCALVLLGPVVIAHALHRTGDQRAGNGSAHRGAAHLVSRALCGSETDCHRRRVFP